MNWVPITTVVVQNLWFQRAQKDRTWHRIANLYLKQTVSQLATWKLPMVSKKVASQQWTHQMISMILVKGDHRCNQVHHMTFFDVTPIQWDTSHCTPPLERSAWTVEPAGRLLEPRLLVTIIEVLINEHRICSWTKHGITPYVGIWGPITSYKYMVMLCIYSIKSFIFHTYLYIYIHSIVYIYIHIFYSFIAGTASPWRAKPFHFRRWFRVRLPGRLRGVMERFFWTGPFGFSWRIYQRYILAVGPLRTVWFMIVHVHHKPYCIAG